MRDRGRAARAAVALALLSVAGLAAALLALRATRGRHAPCLTPAAASCRKAPGEAKAAAGSGHAPAGSPVSIDGGPAGALWPGGPSVPLRLLASNATGEQVALLAVTVTAAGTRGCPAARNVEISQPEMPAPVTVPPHSTVALTGGSVRMPDLATDQDDCRGVTFRLSYAGRVR